MVGPFTVNGKIGSTENSPGHRIVVGGVLYIGIVYLSNVLEVTCHHSGDLRTLGVVLRCNTVISHAV